MEGAAGSSPERASASPAAGAARHRSPAAPPCLEAPLSRLCVGMWASRRHRACQLLLLPEQQQLVVLCDRRTAGMDGVRPSPSRFSLAAGLTAKSPFASGHSAYRHAGCVHAFEIPFCTIRGIQYDNPLCYEARLVLETHNLRKREFATMEAARAYFLEPTCSPQPVHSHPPAGTPESSPAAVLDHRRATSGALQAALQAQQAQQVQQAWQGTPSAAGGNLGAAEDPGSTSSGTRGNLMLRLAGDAACAAPAAQSAAHVAQQAAAAGPALSSSAQPASAPLPIGGAAVGHGGLAAEPPRSARSSFDSLGSDPGAIWYWGSPGSASDALGGSRRTSVEMHRGNDNGGRASQDSWVDLPGPACAVPAAHGPSKLGAACRQPPPALPRPVLHVGSAPNPGGLAGLLASPPEKRQQAALGRLPLPPASSGLHRVASEGTLHSAKSGAATSGSLQQHMACNGEVLGPDGWPAAHAFTTISKVYAYRTVVLNWRDPRIPGMLRPIIQGNERLLKLYESGLPAWAVYAPQYGLYYRPWLRTLTWLLFYAFSVFSFVIGFYDLYKVVPGLQVVMQRLMASLWLPPAAVLEWLEQHTQIRLSILLTYLFGKSEAFVWVVKWCHNFARATRTALQPVSDALGPPLALAGQALRVAGGQAWQALAAVGVTLAAFLQAGLAPIAAVLLQVWVALGAALLPLFQGVQYTTAGPLLWVVQSCGAAWTFLREAGAGLAAGSAALVGTAKAGRAVGGATGHALAEQAVWLYVLPADAMEMLRTSAVKVAKAAQAVAKFCLQMCDNVVRHRLTLGLRAERAWRRTKARLVAVAVAPLHMAAELLKWAYVALRLLLLDRIEAGRLAAQEREQREQVQAAPAAATAATAAASGQSQEPSLRNLPDAAQQVLPVVAAPADATATVAAAGVLGGNAILRRLQSTASSKSHQDAINLAVAAAAPQNGHIKHE